MKACCRFIKDIKGFTCIPFREFPGEFYSLSFSSGQGSGCLAKSDIPQANLGENLQFILNEGEGIKKFHRLSYCHFKDVRYAFTLVFNFQGVPVIPSSFTNIAHNIDIRQKLHLYFYEAFA